MKEINNIKCDCQNSKSPIPKKRLVTCDEVSWLNDVLFRYKYAITTPKPDVSRQNKAARLSAILEIMEILQLGFKDRSARHNALFDFQELYEEKNSEINA